MLVDLGQWVVAGAELLAEFWFRDPVAIRQHRGEPAVKDRLEVASGDNLDSFPASTSDVVADIGVEGDGDLVLGFVDVSFEIKAWQGVALLFAGPNQQLYTAPAGAPFVNLGPPKSIPHGEELIKRKSHRRSFYKTRLTSLSHQAKGGLLSQAAK